MKKLISIIVMCLLVVVSLAFSVAAAPQDMIAELSNVESYETYTSQFNQVSDTALEDVTGGLMVQMVAGNGNIMQANSSFEGYSSSDVIPDDVKTQEIRASISNVSSHDTYVSRYNTIGGNAFTNATGITTVQMSSGNGNILQSNVSIRTSIDIFSSPENVLTDNNS